MSVVASYFARADIIIGGDRPWDIQVHDDRFYRRVLLHGSLGLGESYMERQWDCRDLAGLIWRLLCWRQTGGRRLARLSLAHAATLARRSVLNLQSRARAQEVVSAHYDLPPALFIAMLGDTMAYTCGYWERATTLDEAQRDKLDLICRKLAMRPEQRVLDLGCGFGSFAKYAAERYGVSVVGVNLSPVQTAYARTFCAGLPVDLHECDYRDVGTYFRGERFDRVVSIGMFEAVGRRNFREYMTIVDRVLKPEGLWLLHTIGDEECSADAFSNRHIFPNGELPSMDQIVRAARGLFRIEDVHNFGADYVPTLEAWLERFRAAWPDLHRIDPDRFNDRFHRKWTYFLCCAAGAFRARNIQLWQIVMSNGRLGEYRSVR